MPWLLLIAGGIGYYAWRSGKLRALHFGDVAAAVAALIALKSFGRGEILPAALAAAGIAAWIYRRRRPVPPPAMDADEARRLLDVPPDADLASINEAHRRLIARVHPDAGGSPELASRVNAARDTLIALLNNPPPRAS